jgi:2-hydroxychromene-2-carboxylate isomerase
VSAIFFTFDFISPYAYLAWTQIRTLAAKHERALTNVPILFAALLDANGQKGPAEIPAKRAYLFKDVARKAHRFGAPIRPPVVHPFNPLVALRAATVSPTEDVIDALFRAVWVEGRRIDGADAVREVLAPIGRAEIVDRVTEDAIKNALRSATEAALSRGVFGVPTVEVDGELFWGTDALVDLEHHLSGALPSFPAWFDVPVGVHRKNAG